MNENESCILFNAINRLFTNAMAISKDIAVRNFASLRGFEYVMFKCSELNVRLTHAPSAFI